MRRVQGATVYGYRFDWDGERELLWLDLGSWLGAGHAMEIPFVFGRLSLGASRAPLPRLGLGLAVTSGAAVRAAAAKL